MSHEGAALRSFRSRRARAVAALAPLLCAANDAPVAYEAEGGFDFTVLAMLLLALVFVMVTNLWLRWRSEGLSFGGGLRRWWSRASGSRSKPPES